MNQATKCSAEYLRKADLYNCDFDESTASYCLFRGEEEGRSLA